MTHSMTNGEPCGRPDGHNGGHRSPESMKNRQNQSSDWAREQVKARSEFATVRREYYWRKAGIVGMTVERYEKMLADQGGNCYLCEKDITGTDPAGKRKAQVDHDHTITDHDNVRGLLCQFCNIHLGWLENNPSKIINYIGIQVSHNE